jgi:uncharacterized caspase-like protein/ketosteroid isomerase-like protein
MKTLLCSLYLAITILVAGALPRTVMAQDLQELQVTEVIGGFLNPAGQPLEEYDYLKPDKKYRLMPGAKIELSTLDGKYTYRLTGSGILSFGSSGPVTLNGRPITPSSFKSPLQDVTATGTDTNKLGGTVMRSREGIQVETRTAEGKTRVVSLYSGYYALVIGCGDYSKGWPRLPNPLQDARDIADLLRQIGWNVDLLSDPDWATLRNSLNSVIAGPGRDRDKAILIWFSGHGHTLSEADGSKLGYIVPVDAPDPDRDEIGFMEHAISMREIETVARRIKSKHVLMVFDSCFSGALFQITRAKPPPFIEEKVARPVRQFLTAGDEHEKVPDKSLFKTVFVQGVRDLDADRNKDGYITGQELGAYLQEKVVNYSSKAQHPQYGKINNPKLDKGDFVLVAKPRPTETAPGVAAQGKARALEKEERTPQPLIVAERPLVGKISVTSNVDGAVVKLAGISFKSKNDAALIVGNVPVGEHVVVASKEDYPDWKGQVVVKPEKTVGLSIDFGPKPGPKDRSDEAEIYKVLKNWQDAWNNRDSEALLALFTDSALIMTRTKKGVVTLTKQNFARIIETKLRVREKRGLKIKAEEAKRLDIQGERAKAEVPYTASISRRASQDRTGMAGRETESVADAMGYFELIKQGGRWLINDYKFKRL